MDVSVRGTNLGKNSCSVVGLDATGKVVVRRRMRRETVTSTRRPCRPGSSRWKPVAVRITWVALWHDTGMRCG